MMKRNNQRENDTIINAGWVLREAEEGLRLVESLSSYPNFLANARKHKAEHGSASATFEREILNQAVQVENDARAFLGHVLRVTKHFKNAGLIDEALNSWKERVVANGKLNLQDVWTSFLKSEDIKQILSEASISDSALRAMTEAASQFEQIHEVKEGELTLQTSRHDREIVLARRPAPGQPRTVEDLLFNNQFDAVAEVFDRPGAVILDVIPYAKDHIGDVESIDPLDTLLAGAALTIQEIARHAKKLEDTKLVTYEGDEPATIAAILVGVAVVSGVAILVGGTILVLCTLDVIGNDDVCDAGEAILTFGVVLFVGALDCLLEGCEIVLALFIDGLEFSLEGGGLEVVGALL